MELIRGLQNINASHHGCVLTIGKFDGVHLGHQAVLRNLLEKAKSLNLPSAVMVFEPQPEELFAPEQAPARLSLLRDKYNALKAIGIDRLFCVRFSRTFSNMSPKDFVQSLLVKQLGVEFLVVGDDFKFGHKRLGDYAFLKQHSIVCGFDLASTQSFRLHDSRISSTAIREALAKSDFTSVNVMLGRAFCVSGKVVHGEKNGRKIGFPTANILLNRHKSPVSGVFACRARTKDAWYDAVVNVGNRPTLNGTKIQLEAHLFDFNADLYGQHIKVDFVDKIRDEIKFANFAALQAQISLDAKKARQILRDDTAKAVVI